MEQANRIDYGRLYQKPVEKRSSPRYPFTAAVEAIDTRANIRMVGRLSDISRYGCYIDTISPFAKNADVTLTITKGQQSLRAQANVAYSKEGMGMGLAFTTVEPEQLLVLVTWLEELQGGTPARQDESSFSGQLNIRKNTDDELRHVLRELIALLNSKNVVSDSEGMALLRNLSK